jgi:hypothetical protein
MSPRINVSHYRTEFIVPPDRYLCLQLPPHLPEGKVTVTVTVESAPASPHEPVQFMKPDSGRDGDPDHQDIEWWEEFEQDDGPLEARP